MSTSDDKVGRDEDVEEVQRASAEAAREAFKQAEPAARQFLADVDSDPWGHIVCEGLRAKVQGRPIPIGDLAKMALGNILRSAKKGTP